MTGVLCQHGADPGDDLVPANNSNPKGFFESKTVINLNNQILSAVGSSWDDLAQMPIDWHLMSVVQPLRESIITHLKSRIDSKHNFLVIKDPRFCKTLPLWANALQELNVVPRVVVCYREPSQVAQSERLMKGFPIIKSLMMYVSYNLSAELYTRGFNRIFVEYNELISNQRDVIYYLNKDLELDICQQDDAFRESKTDFIDPNLNRSVLTKKEYEQAGTLSEMASALFKALKTSSYERVEKIRTRFDSYQRDVWPWTKILNSVLAHEKKDFDYFLSSHHGITYQKSSVFFADAIDKGGIGNPVFSVSWPHTSRRQVIGIDVSCHHATRKTLRVNIINRPAVVKFHLIKIISEDTDRYWEIFPIDDVIDCSDSSLIITNDPCPTWLFSDNNSYIDLKLDKLQGLDSNTHFKIQLDVSFCDISTVALPLAKYLTELRAKVSSAAQEALGDVEKISEKYFPLMSRNLIDVHLCLAVKVSEQKTSISSLSGINLKLREELIRFEAQLSLLKELIYNNDSVPL